MHYSEYIEYNNFALTLCKFQIASEYVDDWVTDVNDYNSLVSLFIRTYKKPIDKYVPYWIENA